MRKAGPTSEMMPVNISLIRHYLDSIIKLAAASKTLVDQQEVDEHQLARVRRILYAILVDVQNAIEAVGD